MERMLVLLNGDHCEGNGKGMEYPGPPKEKISQ